VIDSARVVIVGGGIIGTSIAYHLSEMGWKDVVVLERSKLTSGSTFHAAGLVGQLRSSLNVTRMLGYSVELYAKLEKLTGQPTEWKQVGGLRIASSKDRWIELKRQATMARSFGIPVELMSPQEALKLYPIMKLDGIVGAVFLPTDGQVEPASVTQAMAKGARGRGVTFLENVNVEGFTIEKGTVTGVVTDQGRIKAEFVVNAAGQWARELGLLAGVSVPVQSMQHQFLVTEQIPDLPRDLPTMRDPDNLVYFKEEAGALVMGGYEHDPIPWALNGIPRDFNGKLLEPDFDHFEGIAKLSFERVPILETVGVKRLINGPEAFTPDGTFLMGEAPEVRKYFVAAGFNAHGIAAGGGVGRMMAEWIINGEPSLDLWAVDIRRFSSYHRSPKFLLDRTTEAYGDHYGVAWPDHDWHSSRNLRRSPLFETLKSQGACYFSKQGWERPNWFAPKGVEPVEVLSWGRPNYFPYVGAEHKASREGVALFDQTPFSKFEIKGPDAVKALNWICANQIDKPVGTLVYTQMCNQKGGIECDLTVARLADDEFYVVTGTAFAIHDLAWIRKNLPEGARVAVSDITSAKAVINVVGPRSRELLQKVVSQDISNKAFPFMRVPPDHRGLRAGAGFARHLCRRARLRAPYSHRVRGLRLRDLMGGGPGARRRQRRLSRDRVAAPREGLPLLERRHLGRLQPLRGRAGFRGQTRQGRVPRPPGAGEDQERRSEAKALLLHAGEARNHALRERNDLLRGRDGRPRHLGRLRPHRGQVHRLRLSQRPRARSRARARRGQAPGVRAEVLGRGPG
jgi:sarcosine dehydrogenase